MAIKHYSGMLELSKMLAEQFRQNQVQTNLVNELYDIAFEKEKEVRYEINLDSLNKTEFKDKEDALKYAKELANKTGKQVDVSSWCMERIINILPDPKAPEMIPALVKVQNPIPEWWRMADKKKLLMGTAILVEKVKPNVQINLLGEDINTGNCEYRSDRNTKGGNWYWQADDLILYPTQDDTYLHQNMARVLIHKGRRPLI